MKYFKLIVALLALGVTTRPLAAQEQRSPETPDAKIMFSMNSAVVDRSFGDNAKTIETLDRILLDKEQQHKIKHIDVVSSSSIDGSYNLNKNLAQKRINAVRSFLFERYPSVPQTMFKFVALGENWADLRACVVADQKVPYKERVLAVIDNDSAYDRKEVEFKNIREGASWNYMRDNIFPKQRYGVGMVFVLKEEYRNEQVEAETEVEVEPEPQEEVVEPEPEPEPEPQEEVVVDQVALEQSDEILLALKTNLLADVLTAVNLELEVPIGNRYSVATEFKFPWWRGVNSDFTMQILSGHIEGKYWFGDRDRENRLQGFSAGLFTAYGTYDIQPLSKSGVSGDFFEFGLLAGYSHTLYKSLNLEYGIGLGYLHSAYRLYDMSNVDDLGYVKVLREECSQDKIYKDTLVPTRFKVSLVWKFGVPAFWR